MYWSSGRCRGSMRLFESLFPLAPLPSGNSYRLLTCPCRFFYTANTRCLLYITKVYCYLAFLIAGCGCRSREAEEEKDHTGPEIASGDLVECKLIEFPANPSR